MYTEGRRRQMWYEHLQAARLRLQLISSSPQCVKWNVRGLFLAAQRDHWRLSLARRNHRQTSLLTSSHEMINCSAAAATADCAMYAIRRSMLLIRRRTGQQNSAQTSKNAPLAFVIGYALIRIFAADSTFPRSNSLGKVILPTCLASYMPLPPLQKATLWVVSLLIVWRIR